MDHRRITCAVNFHVLSEQQILDNLPTLPEVLMSMEHHIRLTNIEEDFAQDLNSNDIENISLNFAQTSFDCPIEQDILCNLNVHIFNSNQSYDKCVICISEYEIEHKIVELECTHRYHYDCIVEWFKTRNTCPICRAKIR